MLNLIAFKRFFYLGVLLLFISCSKKGGGEPEPGANLPSNLVYNPASLTLQAGTSGSSSKPSVTGTLPLAYSLTTSPGSSGAITIDSDGKITASSTLAAGSYTISVTAANAAGSVKFDNVYTINVTAATPQNLTYTPASVTVTQGTAVNSAVPSITSTSAVTYTLNSAPTTTAISINNQGVISATNALALGTYLISVTATNTNGPRTFPNVYTIIVNSGSGTGTVTYNATIKGIIQSNCGSCHISGAQTEFGNYTAAKSNIDEILRRINLAQGAPQMMPNGGTKLSQATINTIQKWKDDGLLE